MLPGRRIGLAARQSPSDASLAAWSIGLAPAHAGISYALNETRHPKIARAWHLVTLTHVGYTVGHNYSIGVLIGDNNQVEHDCYPVQP